MDKTEMAKHITNSNEFDLIQVTLHKDKSYQLPRGTKIIDILKYDSVIRNSPLVAARSNNTIVDLISTLDEDCHLELIDLTCEDGMRVYQRSLIFVLVRAACEILPGCSVTVKHSLGNGIYGEIDFVRPLKDNDIAAIENRMREIIEADEPILRRPVPRDEVIRLFSQSGQTDTAGLLKYHKSLMVDIHTCNWFVDYSYGPMVPSTGYLKIFKLQYYLPGFILEFPSKENPSLIPEYVERGKLANIFYETGNWHRILNVGHVASLNDIIALKQSGDLIRVAEAFHEKKIGQIADQISANIDRIRIILIAGPSSSGKTTFAQRLAVQLRVNGIRPVAISLDDYFVDRDETPRDEKGEFDFECIDALDHTLFNEHLIKLIQGEEVELPSFNFKKGQREWLDHKLHLEQSDLIIVEGIHGLNDTLTRSIPKGRKFKIYVSALTQLNLDNHNRIPTTDLRILRRIVRDFRTRGYSAIDTIKRWPSVRRGEERNIFPFQESADVMFNSALIYELAVLRKFAEPLLAAIDRNQPEHSEAKRLLEFISYFLTIELDDVPYNSIVREFVGNSCFEPS